jgi:hypothetical protein
LDVLKLLVILAVALVYFIVVFELAPFNFLVVLLDMPVDDITFEFILFVVFDQINCIVDYFFLLFELTWVNDDQILT